MPRPRKPIEQKIIDGSYRPCKDGPLPESLKDWRSGDGPAPGPPKKPKDLSADASKIWLAVLKSIPGRVWPSDSMMLAIYCEWCALWAKCLLTASASPTTQNLTALGIITDKIEKLGAKFGLSPKDRAAMPVENTGPVKAKTPSRPSGIDDEMAKPPSRKKK